jgi:hypothetical protein
MMITPCSFVVPLNRRKPGYHCGNGKGMKCVHCKTWRATQSVEGERFRGLYSCEPELMECFLSRTWIIGSGGWDLAERIEDMARVTRVSISADAAPTAV